MRGASQRHADGTPLWKPFIELEARCTSGQRPLRSESGRYVGTTLVAAVMGGIRSEVRAEWVRPKDRAAVAAATVGGARMLPRSGVARKIELS
mmetsp:Transcript_27230/g.79752  ORF Transcript_27230/g.79752 Transcript_27230/m.79752 type:complete len:93 (+) Transcript_27230:216-494(+)